MSDSSTSNALPKAMREFRGVWVATVANIDWPSTNTLTTEQQKAELLAILDKTVACHMNAVVLQVRPAADAMYPSKLEPWSEYLTGQMGKAPEPFYDPLEFAITEAHKRGLELHGWFNPYRAHHPSAQGPISANHISKTHPEVVKTYGKHLWMDPGEKYVQDYSIKVIMDVVKRYDIDGIHMDDYFYPYKEKGPDGKILDFPDEPSWKKYQASGGTLKRDDWRRENVNKFVKRLYQEIKAEKPWVKFGLSPFGLGRPGKMPAQIKGFDQYSELYADAQKWLNNGWVDYWTPQLYWKIDQAAQSYPVLLKWWAEQNTKHRNLWPGLFTSKIDEKGDKAWPVEEIINQIKVTRETPGASGHVHFSMKPFLTNSKGLDDQLLQGVYAEKALIPTCDWLDDQAPAKPKVQLSKGETTGGLEIKWSNGGTSRVWEWVVYYKIEGKWDFDVLPADKGSWKSGDKTPEAVMVSALDRLKNESPKASVEMPK